MKHPLIFKVAIILLATIGVTACSNSNKGMIWDIAPVVLQIEVQDTNGKNLLDPEIEGNITENGIKVIFEKNVYLKDSIPHVSTRAYMPYFYGLKLGKNDNQGKYKLYFGEFDGAKDHYNRTFVIDWNDGTTNTITFTSTIKWKRNTPKIKRAYTLDGKTTKNPIVIVK